MKFQAFSEARPSIASDHLLVQSFARSTGMAGVRDVARRKLRDITISVAITAAAGVGVIGWVSAATIPGSSVTPGLTGNTAARVNDQQRIAASDDGFAPAPPGTSQPGPGVAVSGGSR